MSNSAAAGPRKRVLFLCTGNSCRSQMAEGWATALYGDEFDAYSAGTHPQSVNPLAVKVMGEAGVDISRHASKHLQSLSHLHFDLVVTVCDNAASSCPRPPKGARVIHFPFDDPPQLAKNAAGEKEALIHYRRVRDEVRGFVLSLPRYLKEQL